MDSIIFRQYDIRGIVGPQFTISETQTIARGIITYYRQQQPDLSTIIVGMDGRTHGPEIKKEVIKAAHDMGIDVVDIGVCPSPAFYFATQTLPAACGIMITASHNPKEYNGFKLNLDKKTVWGSQIQEIAAIITQQSFAQPTGRHATTSYFDIINAYTDWLVNHFSFLKQLPLKVLIDCGNGTAGTVYPQLIEKMKWTTHVDMLFEHVDGTFPNHEADPTVYKNMKQCADEMKLRGGYDLAIGLDGDCDRMAPLTASGKLVSGDQLLALFAQDMLISLPHATVVYDVKSSQSLVDSLAKWGARGHMSPCGHSIIKETMLEHNAQLAGELSCHFFFNDRYFGYDDGIYASLRLLELMARSAQTLDSLVDALPIHITSTEVRLECPEEKKVPIVELVKQSFAQKTDMQVITIDGVRVQSSQGWGLIRASNTQAVLSLRFEAATKDGLQEMKDLFSSILSKHLDSTKVREMIDAA